MHRYRLTIEYDGSPYVGWQRQDNGPSVQGEIEQAGKALSGHDAPCYGAGRTDSGVHALGMAAHIDLQKPFDAKTVKDALNAHLRPQPIAILEAEEVDESFHARFTCYRRHYLYRIINRRAPPTLSARHVWHVGPDLDADAMHSAAQVLIGKHDFTTFRSTQCQADSPFKTLDVFDVKRVDNEVHCTLNAPSFLHNQVRSLVGTIAQVGLGRWSKDDVRDALHATDRSACGLVAPAHGLYFVQADY